MIKQKLRDYISRQGEIANEYPLDRFAESWYYFLVTTFSKWLY